MLIIFIMWFPMNGRCLLSCKGSVIVYLAANQLRKEARFHQNSLQNFIPNTHTCIWNLPDVHVFSENLGYTSLDRYLWICKTCDGTLFPGKMPIQAKANGLNLSEIPPELSCLDLLEMRLICLLVPFMKMVVLPSGKQCCIHGPAVNVPSKLDSVCTILPPLPSQIELIPPQIQE